MRLGLIGLGRIGSFHADTLSQLPAVDSLVVTDAVPSVTKAVAERVGAQVADSPESLISSGVDAIVIAAATNAHTQLIRAGVDAGIPVFCEKPLSGDLSEAVAIARYVTDSGIPVQIGYPRRFDPAFAQPGRQWRPGNSAGSTRCGPPPWTPHPRHASTSRCPAGSSGTAACTTSTPSGGSPAGRSSRSTPPAAPRVPTSSPSSATSPPLPTLLTFDDGATAVVSNTRYNARGHDVRLELHGTSDSVAAGWSDTTPLRNLEPGATWPAGPPAVFFMDRLTSAFHAELHAFTEVVAGQRTSPCTVEDALAVAFIAEAATLSLQQHRPVQIDEVRQS